MTSLRTESSAVTLARRRWGHWGRAWLLTAVALGAAGTWAAEHGAAPARKPESTTAAPDLSLEELRLRLVDRMKTTKSSALQVSIKAGSHGDAALDKAPVARAPRAAKAPAHTDHGPAHWGYAGEGGPLSWGDLDANFATCNIGKRQSPIDIREGIKVELDPIRFDYRPTPFKVIDNGHTVQVNLAPVNSIQVGGRRYELVQFHFHRPSEERINGRQFDMVAHLVHKDPEGRLAVVAVLIEQGRQHPAVQMVWNNLPLERGEENPAALPLDLNGLLPEDRRYYTYMGSLTTPPCTEGVLWMVMKEPVQVSPDQVLVFSRLYPMNARPIQSASGRLIKESN